MTPCKAAGLSIWWGIIMTRVPHAGHALILEPVLVFYLRGRTLLRPTLPTIAGFPSYASHDGRPSVPKRRAPHARRPSHAPASPGSCQASEGLVRLWGQADDGQRAWMYCCAVAQTCCAREDIRWQGKSDGVCPRAPCGRPALSPNQNPCRFVRQRLCYGISDSSLACEARPPARFTNDHFLATKFQRNTTNA